MRSFLVFSPVAANRCWMTAIIVSSFLLSVATGVSAQTGSSLLVVGTCTYIARGSVMGQL
jgi:hypothetical protein